ncbi:MULTISPECIES: hypothetical protein [Nocardiaceae]|uniref:Uncharacterized protein n=1 Tax=Rhodococcoides corynebacterioides TaxID=53972 RepID=A0ABS2KUC1_9NOCA|nr:MULTISPECIES: hypothetical protein [Rhodococcus]MBM7415545.1 hypothetical protein [Rhodococcus corynebacterioides]MBP1118007.1 hypothetical protein [Rhodococcus sp. PvP016]
MTRQWATSVAHAAVLAVVLSLLWHFAAPVTPFDPFTADLGDAPTASISILGYQHAFVTLGPAWLPSSLLIFVACIASFIGTMLLIRNADRHRLASPPARAMAVRWWPMAVSAIIGLSVAAVAAISPPQSRGFGVVDPSSIQARMEDSVLFRESIGIFALLCFAASLLVVLLFAALPARWRPAFAHG